VSSAQSNYFPPSESDGGWRSCLNDDDVRTKAGLDPRKLNIFAQTQYQIFAGPWAIVVVRNGYVAAEWLGVPANPGSTFDIWSCTKSATAIAFGMLFADRPEITLESPAYEFIPEGQPLSDVRRSDIKLKHLLSMTSGIAGEAEGVMVLPVTPGRGEFEMALGKEATRFQVLTAAMMAAPGERWNYSDLAYSHLSLIFSRITGREINDYLRERLFAPLGIRNYCWDMIGGAGHIGPHTNPGAGLHISARDLSRLGYLLAHKGIWEGKRIVPEGWINLATQSSQNLNRSYGYGFWVNTDGIEWPAAPRDAFAFKGFGANRCHVVPSLDLVVVRVGYAPPNWGEDSILPAILDAVI
jgi:CubicO group peptidase (beta-lactamase class C family)